MKISASVFYSNNSNNDYANFADMIRNPDRKLFADNILTLVNVEGNPALLTTSGKIENTFADKL